MANAADAKGWAREHLVGLWASPMIPFDSELALHEAGITSNINLIIDLKAAGVGYGYSEPWHCSHAERRRGMEVVADAVKGRVPFYFHVTDHSVVETIALAQHADSVGADAVMVWAPFEFAKSEDMMCEYFEYVASRTDIAIMAYNTPHSGRTLSVEALERIARIPAVCAVKNGINDFTHSAELARHVGDSIVVSEPLEENLPKAILEYGQQTLFSTTSVFLMQSRAYQPIKEYMDHFLAGREAQGWAGYHDLEPLRGIWKGLYSSVWSNEAASHPIGLTKAWMDIIGMYGGPVRPPGAQVSDEAREKLVSSLTASGWLDRLFPDGLARETPPAKA